MNKGEGQSKGKLHDNVSAMTEADIHRLLDELEVHQTQLKQQNDELQLAKEIAEFAAKQYGDLFEEIFEFSPAGYYTLDQNGTIYELNTSGAIILGKKRGELENSDIRMFVAQESLPVIDGFLEKLFETKLKQTCELRFITSSETPVFVYIEGIVTGSSEKCLLTIIDISERKLAEEALKESQAKFRIIADNTYEWEFWQALDESYIYQSPSCERISGYTAADFYLDPGLFLKIIHPDDKHLYTANNLLASNRKEPVKVEFRVITPDNKVKWVEQISQPLFNDVGEFLGARGSNRDITDRKQADEALALAAKQWQITFDALNDGVCILGNDHRILRCNKAMIDLFPETGHNMVGKHCWEVVHGTRSPHEDCPMNDMLKSLKRECADVQVSGKWFEVVVDPYFNEDKNLAGAVHIVRDITKKKVSLENLALSEELFRKAFKLHPGIVELSTLNDGKYVDINIHFTEIFGWQRDEVIGKTSFDLGIYSDYNQRKELLSKIEKNGSVKDYKIELRTKDGEIRIGNLSAEIIVLGHEDCLLIQINDVTEQIRSEEALKESEARLRELNATKDRFFSIIAHDLKSPFNNILGFSNLLADLVKDNDNREIVEFAEIIKTASEQAMDLLLNLLEWSRMQTGKIPFTPRAVDMVMLVQEACDLSAVSARLKNINIFPYLPEKLMIIADKAMVGVILRNLISNAVKYTDSGGSIVVSAQMPENELLISVRDNGVGISKPALEKLFRIEESISTKGTRNEKGTGLGLLLCKEFVEKHNGKIWVESEPGKGSTFYFTIPMKGSIQ